MDNSIMHKLSYGLFVISAKNNEKINGCIINTVMQVTSEPLRIVVALNKNNYTHDLIVSSKEFNISILTNSVPFEIFQNFGFKCGRDCEKFKGIDYKISSNGLPYLSKYSNSYMECKVVNVTDLGTHSLFLADVIDGEKLNAEDSLTYEYYHKNIKVLPPVTSSPRTKTVWRCTVCGYEYEGEVLPPDYICPVCHQPASVFVKIEGKAETAPRTVWRCKICGYIYDGEDLPADFICPVCKHPASDFEKITI